MYINRTNERCLLEGTLSEIALPICSCFHLAQTVISLGFSTYAVLETISHELFTVA